VKTDEVGAQKAAEQLVSLRQRAEQFLGGKWDVQEEPDPGVGQALAQQAWQEEQVIVMHPDEVARLIVLRHDIGETLVHLGVRLPVPDMERHLIQQIVEEGPENAVGEPLVVAADLLGGEGHRHQPHFGELAVEL
jgi:hypothetical protein